VEDGLKDEAIQAEDDGSATDEIEQSGLRDAGTFNLLELELVRPNDDGPPNELIEENDDGDHRGDAPENRARVAMARRRLKKRAEAGEAKVRLPRTNISHAIRKNQPPATDIMEFQTQADGGKGKVELGEALPAAETIDDRGFLEFAWNSLQRRVKTKGDVPDLACKDEQMEPSSTPSWLCGRSRPWQHDSRQETEHGDDWRISSSGTMMISARRELAAI